MRKIIVISFVSLDGIMQAPGGPEEDTEGGFKYGGWVEPFGDETFGNIMVKQMESTDLLLGRKTFEIFASYWPNHANDWPGINDVTKYVISGTIQKSDWENSVFLNSLADIENLKKTSGSELKVCGSSELVHLLLEHDMVDELWLKIFPLILGKGKKLFTENSVPAAFTLTESTVATSGVIFANYKRAGKVKTGAIGS